MSRNYDGYSQPIRKLPCAPIRSMPKNQKRIEITLKSGQTSDLSQGFKMDDILIYNAEVNQATHAKLNAAVYSHEGQ